MKKYLVLLLIVTGAFFTAVETQAQAVCTPTTTVTEGDLFPGGIVSFSVTSGPGSVTVDHVNAGTGLQSLSVIGAPMNAVVTIPAFSPGTTAPVTVTFTRPNPALAVDFTLRAASTFHAAFIRVRCPADTSNPDTDGDGVIDAVDNCPSIPNLDQADHDGDGLGDACDPDNDGDGIPNTCDVNSNPGEPDFDRDGIVDSSSCDTQIGPPTNRNQCRNGGWMRFNTPRTFSSQRDCIEFVITGN